MSIAPVALLQPPACACMTRTGNRLRQPSADSCHLFLATRASASGLQPSFAAPPARVRRRHVRRWNPAVAEPRGGMSEWVDVDMFDEGVLDVWGPIGGRGSRTRASRVALSNAKPMPSQRTHAPCQGHPEQ